MKAKTIRKVGYIVGCLVALLTIVLFLGSCLIIAAASWIITCGIVYLIMWCLGLTFTWQIGTGVWLIVLFLSWIFKKRG